MRIRFIIKAMTIRLLIAQYQYQPLDNGSDFCSQDWVGIIYYI